MCGSLRKGEHDNLLDQKGCTKIMPVVTSDGLPPAADSNNEVIFFLSSSLVRCLASSILEYATDLILSDN